MSRKNNPHQPLLAHVLGEDKGMYGFVALKLLSTVSLPDWVSHGKDR